MKFRNLLIILTAGLLAAACSTNTEAPASHSASVAPAQTASMTNQPVPVEKQKLLFFINPNGRPCQIQKSILDGMNPGLAEKLDVVYVATTDPAARQAFYDYGIRSLPNLILTDSKGNVVKRFPPGIQGEEIILNALGS